jgi:hypothetical protein
MVRDLIDRGDQRACAAIRCVAMRRDSSMPDWQVQMAA